MIFAGKVALLALARSKWCAGSPGAVCSRSGRALTTFGGRGRAAGGRHSKCVAKTPGNRAHTLWGLASFGRLTFFGLPSKGGVRSVFEVSAFFDAV